ncbi:hypothetical protein MHY1_02482 [Methylovirgula sp. HY1]|nr:hypothetical protein MHY1_02482 [Methylovirgula sp. HY1]
MKAPEQCSGKSTKTLSCNLDGAAKVVGAPQPNTHAINGLFEVVEARPRRRPPCRQSKTRDGNQ